MITPIRSKMRSRRATVSGPSVQTSGKHSQAFSLVELLVVVAIVGALAAVIMPTISVVRARAQSSQCQSNLRQLHGGCMAYAANHGGWLPPSQDDGGVGAWWKQIYPDYIDSPSVFVCPLDETGGISDANAQLEGNGKLSYGAMGNDDVRAKQGVMDKNLGDFVWAGKSVMLLDDPKSGRQLAKSWFFNWPKYYPEIQAPHDGKVNMVFVDGHVDSMTLDEIEERMREGTIKTSYGNMTPRTPKLTN